MKKEEVDRKYPTARNWEAKVSSIPNIPRSENGFLDSLRIILMECKNGTPLKSIINIPGSSSKIDVETCLVRIRPAGFVKNIRNVWELSSESQQWLESNDDFYIGSFLSGNIKFFSEILALLIKKNSSIREIREFASEEYNLDWKTKSEIHARLKWLRDLDFIKYNELNSEYRITDKGTTFYEIFGYVKSEDINLDYDITVDEKEFSVSDWANSIFQENRNTQKKTGIGYIPGGNNEIYEVIKDYLITINDKIDFKYLEEYSKNTFDISSNSTRQALYTLEYLGFIQRITKTTYKLTDLGSKVLADSSEIDFIFCIDAKYSFVLDILIKLKEKTMSIKELAIESKIKYEFPSDNNTYISKRVHILKNAQLIREAGLGKFELTKRGLNFCEEYKKFYKELKIEKASIELSNESDILNELRISSRDSTNSKRFEQAIQKAFSLLGFKSEWLGGAGKTDIIIEAPTSPKFSYKVAIDAKATYSGGVTEGQINFDTINDHRRNHDTDYSMIIGYEFQGERLIKRAAKHGVTLLSIDELEKIIKNHYQVPLKSNSYKKVFEQNGLVDSSVLNSDRNKIIREGNLLRDTMKCLYDEGEDPYTEGIISSREIYLILKNQFSYNPVANIGEITEILDFLASPVIGCIGKNKDGYYALGSLADASKTFEFLLKATTNVKL